MLKIEIPRLIIDEQKVRQNIKNMAKKARDHHLIFRPHFKTHQSIIVGRWFKEEEIDKITVSSLNMAQYFQRDGWEDITIAFPFNIHETKKLKSLVQKGNINILVANEDTVRFVANQIDAPLGIFIKIDTGYHRAGILSNNLIGIDKLIQKICSIKNFTFKGFIVHAGHTYHTNSKEEILEIHSETIQKLSELKKRFKNRYSFINSIGDTPSCSLADSFENIDEIRPGNFVFYDGMQYNLGSCDESSVGVVMYCPVVDIQYDRNELIIYGGAVHFSKDSIFVNDQRIFGFGIDIEENKWDSINENKLISLSQEHGILKVPVDLINTYKIGDIVGIVPIHSCLTANLMRGYISTRGEFIDHLNS